MHLYLFLRGKIEFVSIWESHVQAQYLKFRRTNIKTKKEEPKLVQLALRKSVLGAYELVFPKESLAEVLALLGAVQEIQPAYEYDGNKFKLAILRKIFGCKKISKKVFEEANQIFIKRPTMSITGTERGLSNAIVPGTAVHVIGIKEDSQGVFGDYEHEAL